jgi:hypothetical protein
MEEDTTMVPRPVRDGLPKGLRYHLGDKAAHFKRPFHFRHTELMMIVHIFVIGLIGRVVPHSSHYRPGHGRI